MPRCAVLFTVAKGSGVLQAPAGVHLPVPASYYVVQIHYDNVAGVAIRGDTSGFRLWVDPAAQGRQGRTLLLHSGFESIRIPSSTGQSEHSLQFLISSNATASILPPGGVQVFATVPHMHGHGHRSRIMVIRNGVHFKDALRTRGFDFSRQGASYVPQSRSFLGWWENTLPIYTYTPWGVRVDGKTK